LWCGTPPQRQTLIINTGGHGTAFPCTGCQGNCGKGPHTDDYFQPERSSTFQEPACDQCAFGECPNYDPSSRGQRCQFSLGYAEGSSWTSTEANDYCYIGGLHNKALSIDDTGADDLDPHIAERYAFHLHFCCQTSLSGLFQEQLADGILAMDNSNVSFWHQMYDKGKISDELFSLCYSRQPSVSREGTRAGAMTLGGSDDRLHLYPMVYSKHEDVWGKNYGVLLRKIHLREGGGGLSAKPVREGLRILTLDVSAEVLNEGTVIIESGTTDTYMSSAIRPAFEAAWKQLTSVEYNPLRQLQWDPTELQQLPTILLQFEGSQELNEGVDASQAVNLAHEIDPEHPFDIIIAIPPEHYMEYVPTKDAYMARFYMSEAPRGTSVIGANTMTGHDILFDAKNRRIGWAESHCDYSQLLRNAGFDPDGNDDQRPVAPPDSGPITPQSGSTESSTTYTSGEGSSSSGACSSMLCRFSIMMVVGSVLVAAFLVKQRGNRRDYRGVVLEHSELELQEGYAGTQLS